MRGLAAGARPRTDRQRPVRPGTASRRRHRDAADAAEHVERPDGSRGPHQAGRLRDLRGPGLRGDRTPHPDLLLHQRRHHRDPAGGRLDARDHERHVRLLAGELRRRIRREPRDGTVGHRCVRDDRPVVAGERAPVSPLSARRGRVRQCLYRDHDVPLRRRPRERAPARPARGASARADAVTPLRRVHPPALRPRRAILHAVVPVPGTGSSECGGAARPRKPRPPGRARRSPGIPRRARRSFSAGAT